MIEVCPISFHAIERSGLLPGPMPAMRRLLPVPAGEFAAGALLQPRGAAGGPAVERLCARGLRAGAVALPRAGGARVPLPAFRLVQRLRGVRSASARLPLYPLMLAYSADGAAVMLG